MPNNTIKAKLNAAHVLLAVMACLIGVIAMANWLFNSAVIHENTFNWRPSQFNAALCIVLTSAAVLLIQVKPRLGNWLSLAVLTISLLTILEYLFHTNLGIDQIFINHRLVLPADEHPGRMAPNTTVCFILLSTALLIHINSRTNLAKFTQLTFAVLVFGLASMVLLGYFFGISFAYGWSVFTAMAIYTACAFLVLSLSLIVHLYCSEQTFYSKHGVTQMMGIIVGGFLVFVLLWQMLVANYLEQLQRHTKENAFAILTQIQWAMNENFLAGQRFVNLLNYPQLDNAAIAKDAEAYLTDMPTLDLIAWSDKGLPMVRVQSTKAVNPAIIWAACERGFQKNDLRTSIVTGVKGKSGFCLYNQNYRTSLLYFDLEKTLAMAIKPSQLKNNGLVITYQGNPLYEKASPASESHLKQWSITEDMYFSFLQKPIQLQLWPSRTYLESYIPWFPSLFFWLGVITTLLLAYVNLLKQKLTTRNLELQSSLTVKNHRLVEMESKYQRIYDFSPDLYLFVDTNNIIVECNETFVDTMGFFRKKGVIGHKLFERLKVQDPEKQAIIAGHLAKTGYLSNLELNLVSQEGSICEMMLKINPFLDHNQKLIGYLFSFRDISDLRKLESELADREYSVSLFKENKVLYDLVLNETTDGWWDINMETQECSLSPQLVNSLGFNKDQKGAFTFFRDNIYPEDWPLVESNLKKHILSQGKSPFKQVVRYRHRDGHIVWIYCRGQGILDPDGRIRRIVGTHVDITPLKSTQAQLSKKVRELNLISQVTHLIAISSDKELLLSQCLSAITLSTSFDYAIAYRFDELGCKMKPVTCWSKALTTTEKSVQDYKIIEGDGLVGQCWRDKKIHWLSSQKTIETGQWPLNQFKSSLVFPIIVFDQVAMIFQFFGTEKEVVDSDDVSMFELLANQTGLAFEKMKSHYLLQQLASHDELTQLPNRRACIEMLELTLNRAARMGRRFGLMFLDLDGFKWVNDHLGHHIGDLLLIEVGLLFKSCLRSEDYLARLGGDEFLVIMPDILSDDILNETAARLVNVLSKPLLLENNTVSVSVSIGITTYPESGKTVEQMLKLADHAMYRVKQQGKNSYYAI